MKINIALAPIPGEPSALPNIEILKTNLRVIILCFPRMTLFFFSSSHFIISVHLAYRSLLPHNGIYY